MTGKEVPISTMKPKFAVSSGNERAADGRRSLNRRSLLFGEKQNRCVIIQPKVNMVAETIERRHNSWFVRTKATSDLVILVGKSKSFHLHMLPMVSRSGYLNRMAFQSKIASGENKRSVQLDNLPGGADTFELVVKFCYGWKVDLTANNVVPLYCAAKFLEMSDDFEATNLISRAEIFLSFLLISSWKDTFRLLKSCEHISSWARDLRIQTRCSEAIAWKVSTDPEAIALAHDGTQCLNYLVTGTKSSDCGKVSESWWFEDVSSLRIDHFIEVVASIKKKGMKPKLLGSCIANWTAKWLTRMSFGAHKPTQKTINSQVRKVVLESLVRILPVEENSVPCNFLLHLLKVGRMMNIEPGLSSRLEKRIALMLEHCQPMDLLVKNYAESVTLYDVKVIVRVVQAYVTTVPCYSSKMFVVARLMDGFLAMVAKDKKLPPQDFQLLIEALPSSARDSDDNLYRAIDTYLKAHPELEEEERKGVCRAMEYHKLSQEAREHAMKNERLPLNITTQFVLLEQVKMARLMTDSGLVYRRNQAQAVIRVDTDERNGFMDSKREVNMIKVEVERLKLQLGKMQLFKLQIKRMANAGKIVFS
ncbi:hypothetical protein V2J09_001048 [Rumex salicifolius]